MSLSWRRRIIAGLAPDGLSILRLARGVGFRIESHETIAIDPDPPGSWLGPVAALKDRLQSDAVGGDVDVLLSSHFAHFVVVPPGPQLGSAVERQALAGIVFGRQFGSLSQGWDIQVTPGGSNEPALACGVCKALLSDLDAAVPAGHRLRSVRPVLMDVVNHSRRHLTGGATCLALVEAGRITWAWLRDSAWQAVASRAVDHVDGDTVASQFRQQLELNGQDQTGTLWLSDVTAAVASPVGLSWQVRRLAAPSEGWKHPGRIDGLVGWCDR